MCRGAKIIFGQFVRVSKEGFSNKNVHFLFLSFLWSRKKKRKHEKKWKNKISEKAQKNSVFWVFVKKTGLFCKNVIF